MQRVCGTLLRHGTGAGVPRHARGVQVPALTHEVLNQADPLGSYNAFTEDTVSRGVVASRAKHTHELRGARRSFGVSGPVSRS